MGRSEFAVNRAKENPFAAGELRTYIATSASERRPAGGCTLMSPRSPVGGGLHYHDVEFQMVLRGTSTVWFEGQGEVTFEAGDCQAAPGTTFTRTITRCLRSRFPRKTVQLEA